MEVHSLLTCLSAGCMELFYFLRLFRTLRLLPVSIDERKHDHLFVTRSELKPLSTPTAVSSHLLLCHRYDMPELPRASTSHH